jgi:hypothetical protein
VPRDEVEAAYFSLLRAREELADLHRYEAYLRAEAQRLRRSTSEAGALAEQVTPRQRRALRHSDRVLDEAIRERLAVLADELQHLPERITAAERFVDEAEREHRQLRGAG